MKATKECVFCHKKIHPLRAYVRSKTDLDASDNIYCSVHCFLEHQNVEIYDPKREVPC